MPVLSQLFGAARRGPLRPLSCSIPHDETDTGPCSRQHCCRHSLSPVQSRIRASYHSPNGSALRANPCPEVTDPVCRLPLPTLFYRQRLFTLETCCGYGYGPARNSNRLPRIFKGRRECTGHRGKRGALRRQRPYLRASRFQGWGSLQRKENSSRGSRRRLPLRLRYRTLSLRTNLRVQVREY